MEDKIESTASLTSPEKNLANQRAYQKNYQRTYRKIKVRKEVVFTKTEFSKIKINAKSYGHKVAQHIKACTLAYISKTPLVQNENELKNMRWEIRKIGVNINQMAYQVNKYGRERFDEMKLHQLLAELETIIEGKFEVTQISETNLKKFVQLSRFTISELETLLKDTSNGN